MNSYQKLKSRIRELETKLMIVCTDPNSMNSIYIKAEQKLKASLIKSMWAGNAITKETYGK
jgi:hypothetical protein